MTGGRPSRYEVVFDSRAGKELGKLDIPVARRVYSAVMALAEEPRPDGCRQLSGYPGLWRIRVATIGWSTRSATVSSWWLRCA